MNLTTRSGIIGPLTRFGVVCPWPWRAQQLDPNLGLVPCEHCNEIVHAGQRHPDYREAYEQLLVEPPPGDEVMAAFRRTVPIDGHAKMLCMMSLDAKVVQIDMEQLGAKPQDALRRLTRQLPEQHGRPLWVTLALEGFVTAVRTEEVEKIASTIDPTELADRFDVGMSGVDEAGIAVMAHRDGRTWTAMQPFRRECGTIKWLKLIGPTPGHIGPLADIGKLVGVPVSHWDGSWPPM